MSEDISFRDLIHKVRAGDSDAATELVRRYEPSLRLAVHVRLTDPGLRRVLDSMDICQSVLASFFVRAAGGQYELDTPDQLLKLLATMARHKVINAAKHQRAARRDYRRVRHDVSDEAMFPDPQPSPSQVVANKELLSRLWSLLSPDDRDVAEQRAAGRSWQEIAAERGEQPGTLRMRLSRALDRVTHELGLDD